MVRHMHSISCLFLLIAVLAPLAVVRADVYDEFPQWDPVHWVVRSTDIIRLPCTHRLYYPFNDISKAIKVTWILPERTSYRHLAPNESDEGWQVLPLSQDYTLYIDKSLMNIPDSVDGMYVCAALAKVDPNNSTSEVYAWSYLRWGVGLYTNVPAMNEGTIGQKYYWCFTYAWVSCLVTIVIMVLFAVAVHFHYKGGAKMPASEEGESDELSLAEEKKSSPSPNRARQISVNAQDDEPF